jgi:hypothetical protein
MCSNTAFVNAITEARRRVRAHMQRRLHELQAPNQASRVQAGGRVGAGKGAAEAEKAGSKAAGSGRGKLLRLQTPDERFLRINIANQSQFEALLSRTRAVGITSRLHDLDDHGQDDKDDNMDDECALGALSSCVGVPATLSEWLVSWCLI